MKTSSVIAASVLVACSSLSAHPGHTEPLRKLVNEQKASKAEMKALDTPAASSAAIAPAIQNLPEKVRFEIFRDGETYTLDLHKRSVRSENAAVRLDFGNGDVRSADLGPVRTYSGTLLEDSGAEVTACLAPDGLCATVRCSDGTCWKVLPPETPGGAYRTADLVIDTSAASGASLLTPDQVQFLASAGYDTSALTSAFAVPNIVSVKQAEIGFEYDSSAWARLSGTTEIRVQKATAIVENFLNDTLNQVYISDVLVEHLLGVVSVRMDSATDPYRQPSDGFDPSNASNLLRRFRDIWNGSNSPSSTHDIGHLLVSRSIGVGGLGFVGTVGTGSRYALSAVGGEQGSLAGGNIAIGRFGGVGRHEISHNWSCNHGNGCGVEIDPAGNDFSLGMCTGSGRRANSSESGRARNHRNSRNSNVLVDIGPFPTSQEPYCPLDNATAFLGGSPVLIDVLANDFDANNDPIQIESVAFRDFGDGFSRLGGILEISSGTGPGGRDQVRYTPPIDADISNSNVDAFHYIVREDSADRRTSFGYVLVTLRPDIAPGPVSPLTYLADSVEQWSPTQNPNGLWTSGTLPDPLLSNAPVVFTVSQTSSSDESEIAGGDGVGWEGTDSARNTQFSSFPGDNHEAVRRWKSSFQGPVMVEYTVSKLLGTSDQPSDGQVGETAVIRHNGNPVWTQSVMPGDRFSGMVPLTLAKTDTVDFVSNSGGNSEGDGIYFRARIVAAYTAVTDPALLFHYPLDEGSTDPAVYRNQATDVSGNNHHATVENAATGDFWRNAQLGNGASFGGGDEALGMTDANVGDGATEMTLSVWFKADSIDDNRGLLSSTGSYFALTFRNTDGFPLEFRGDNASLFAPESANSSPVGRWTHAAGVWRAGRDMRLYVNGEEVAFQTTGGSAADIDRWFVGRDREISGRGFVGMVDDAAVWSRALTGGEIRALHSSGRTSFQFNGDIAERETILVSPVPQGSDELTLASWVEISDIGNNHGFVTSIDTSSAYFALLTSGRDGNPAEFRAHSNSLRGVPGSLPEDELIHIAGTWSSGQFQRLYLNGRRVNETAGPNNEFDVASWGIGADRETPNRALDGSVGEILITGRAYNDAEIGVLAGNLRTWYDAGHGFFTSIARTDNANAQAGLREASGIVTLTGAGTGFAGNTDNFVYASRPHSGDVDLSTRLESHNASSSSSGSGLAIRAGSAASAPAVSLIRNGLGNLVFRARTTTGATPSVIATAPGQGTDGTYLRLVRSGNSFSAESSQDGVAFVSFGTATVNMPTGVQIGLAFAPGSSSVEGTAQFSQTLLDPTSLDSDLDGLPDAWEITFFCDLTTSGNLSTDDFDNDGLSDGAEFAAGTNPTLADTDADGLTDSQELLTYNTDPFEQDTDGDGLSDGDEVNSFNSSPTLTDTDSDGISDPVEVGAGSNPSAALDVPVIASVDRLKAYWNFDETSGGRANDLVANADGFWRNSNGNDSGNLTWTDGIIGGSAMLTGVDTRDEFTVRSDPLAGASELTISSWVLPQTLRNFSGVVVSRDTGNQKNWGLNLADNLVDARSDNSGIQTNDLIFTGNGWYHLAMVWRPGENEIYVNGVLAREGVGAPSYTSAGRWWLGTDNAGFDNGRREHIGLLDDIAMLDVALTAEQIAVIHDAGRGGQPISTLLGPGGPEIIAVDIVNGDFFIAFDSELGSTYSVYTSTDLTVPVDSWQLLTPDLIGTGAPMIFTHNGSGSESRRFFIVRGNPGL